MRAKTVNENMDFSRGDGAKKSMRVGELKDLPDHIDTNVPQELKKFGFKYRDMDDEVYLDDFKDHRLLSTYIMEEYDEIPSMTFFLKMEENEKWGPEISLDWEGIKLDTAYDILEIGLNGVKDFTRILKEKGRWPAEQYIEEVFSNISTPEIGYFNFNGKYGISDE